MAIQIDNSGTTGKFTLKPPSSGGGITLTFPTTLSATKCLTTDGAGNLSFAAIGLVGFTAQRATAAPNATVNVAQLLASGGTATQGVAIFGNGTSQQLLAVIPDGTTSGGNARTAAYLVDMCYFSAQGSFSFGASPIRSAATQIPNATRFINIGGWMQTDTNSTYSCNILGFDTNWVNAPNSCAVGGDVQSAYGTLTSNIPAGGLGNNVAIGFYDFGLPTKGLWTRQNQVMSGSPNLWNIPQSFQYGHRYTNVQAYFVLSAQTTNATATVLTADATAATANNCIGIGNSTQATFEIYVTAMVKTPNGNAKAWVTRGMIIQNTTAASTAIVGTPFSTSLGADTGASSWTIAVSADATLGALTVTVTGQASTSIQWVASCLLTGYQYS